MADSKISALSAVTSLAQTDEMVIASSGATKKMTGTNLRKQFTPHNRNQAMLPTGALAETFPATHATAAGGATSGQVRYNQIYLPVGTLVTSISYISVAALSGISNQVFGLADSSYALLRSTTDDTTTAWGANAVKTLNLTSTFTTTYSGLHYLAFLVVASGMGTHVAGVSITGSAMYSAVPYVCFAHGTGSQTSIPNPATSPSAQNVPLYGYVS